MQNCSYFFNGLIVHCSRAVQDGLMFSVLKYVVVEIWSFPPDDSSLLFSFFFGFFSSDGSHIISGSENGFVYLWRTYHDVARAAPAARRDVNDAYESFAGKTKCALLMFVDMLLPV